MDSRTKKYAWLAVVLVVGAALAFAGPAIVAGITNNTAEASGGCGMDMGSSGGGCGMMGGTSGADTGAASTAHQACPILAGTALAVDKRDGSITVKIKPGSVDTDVARKALSQVKVGDSLSLGMVLGKDGKPTAANTKPAAQAAAYTCPMHPEVTSDKPGSCPKCGMDLVKTSGGQK